MTELSERQFKLLENLVNNGVYAIMFPSLPEDATEVERQKYTEIRGDFSTLIEAGFVEDHSAKIKEQVDKAFRSGEIQKEIEAVKELGIKVPDDYEFKTEVFALTENAIRMFAPSQGATN